MRSKINPFQGVIQTGALIIFLVALNYNSSSLSLTLMRAVDQPNPQNSGIRAPGALFCLVLLRCICILAFAQTKIPVGSL
jgi:hypothetical protein